MSDFHTVAMCRMSSLVAPDSVVTPRALNTPLCPASTPLLSPRDAPGTYPMHIVYAHSQDMYRFRVSYASHHHLGSRVSSYLLHTSCISLPHPPHTFRSCPLSTETLELLS